MEKLFGSGVSVPEWLSGMTRNHVGSARAGSNPAAHALGFFFLIENFKSKYIKISYFNKFKMGN